MQSNKSINVNGCSVCEEGKESYTTFIAGAFKGTEYYQYDFRINGELFSTVAKSLEECRARRNEWLKEKSKGKYILFRGFQRLGEFNTISEAKRYARESGLAGVFNLLGHNYRDAWHVFEDETK